MTMRALRLYAAAAPRASRDDGPRRWHGLPAALLLLLAGCAAVPPVDASRYACPDGRVVQAGTTPDQRLLVLVVEGRRQVLGRQDDGSYGNGRYTARPDDLFLHLGTAGTLLPQHCRLLDTR